MSDPRDKKPESENQEPEQTLIRGQDASASEPNDDETVINPRESSGRGPGDAPDEPNDNATLIRARDQDEPNDNETIVRGKPEGQAEGNDNETIVRGSRASDRSGADDETAIAGSEPRSATPASSGDAATILRSPDGDAATILRGPESDSATILRGPDEDAATVLRSGDASPADDVPGDDDATIIGGMDDDDDRTVINDNYDDDATIMGPGSEEEDTTYIASVGKQIRPQGNTEAGRLLKNRFVLEEKIGSGGMGDVYKALDLRQQEAQERDPYIAIKLLNENFSRHKDAFLSLQRETSRTRGIPHPNIMAVYDFDREGDTVFMSMELLDGKPLDDFLKEHPEGVSEEDAWRIIDGISQGLRRAHNAGIVHSDFKPGNIFYTKDKTAKVFDFGIARAVSSPGELEADGEKTVFDAGSLGALTPTYASYEMLTGKEPSKSDDVYAVALVAYELFMGKHPYDRVPADKALERGLTPKPVPFLKRRHWRALKKGLALKGEDRTQTMDEFIEGMFSEDPPYFRYAAIATVILGSIGFATYSTLNVKEKPPELVEFEDVKAASENIITGSIRQMDDNTVPWDSDVWHEQLAGAFNRWHGAEILIQENQEWVEEWELEPDKSIDESAREVLDGYLTEIRRIRQVAGSYGNQRHESIGSEQAKELLEKANVLMGYVQESYKAADSRTVTNEAELLQNELQLRVEEWDGILAAEEAEAARLEAERIAREEAEAQRIFEENRERTYTAYLDRLQVILKCKGDVPVEQQREIGSLMASMRSEWREAYDFHYPTIVGYLSTCIQQRIGFVSPEKARAFKEVAMGFLPGEAEIANLVIEDKDPCAERKLEGRGNLSRNWCADPLSEGGDGPELVVIPPLPGKGISQKYAISRAEIKVAEYNQYCANTGCAQLNELNSIPATNLSIEQVNGYVAWLSAQTGKSYRLPTEVEWKHAAQTNNPDEEIDTNINCTVDSRGVRLGEKLLSAVSGRANSWGLYNYVGNARELALTDEDSLVALGGAHTDPRHECTLEKRIDHQGQADAVTGFRIVREIEIKDLSTNKAELASST